MTRSLLGTTIWYRAVIQRGQHHLRGTMGQVIMLGSLLGIIVVIVGLVLRFDPEARRDGEDER
jgi:hypothetical protein